MGKPTTLLEGLCGHALALGAESIEVTYKDGREWVFANKGGMGIAIANYASSSKDAKELRGNLHAGSKKSVRAVLGRRVYILKVTVFESFGEDAFVVSLDPARRLDPSIAPSFTAKQGQYLAFIHPAVGIRSFGAKAVTRRTYRPRSRFSPRTVIYRRTASSNTSAGSRFCSRATCAICNCISSAKGRLPWPCLSSFRLSLTPGWNAWGCLGGVGGFACRGRPPGRPLLW